jgi:hypothetical protein
MKKLKITVTPAGEVAVEAEEFAGNACVLASNPFVARLGVQTKQTVKPEMFEEATQQEREKQ